MERDYQQEFTDFLAGYAQVEDTELVLLIDEFPQAIENLKKVSEAAAITFLQGKRALRLDPGISKKVKFIYTGSIGLNHTVSRLNATAAINDLNSIEIGPLTDGEAIDLFTRLLESNNRKVGDAARKRLLEIIQWHIPFHIQLMVQEVVQITAENSEISAVIMEEAIENMLSLRNQNHFDHYYSRLKEQFKDDAFKYVNELLKEAAVGNAVSRARAFDLSVKYHLQDCFRKIIEILLYDGYIHHTDDLEEYRFTSPVVKRWWRKFIC
jgi:hypothetical protein